MLESMTIKECKEIGNLAFRKHLTDGSGKDEPYQSYKWKLHLFINDKGVTEGIAIVDERESPLKHIDDLWSKPPMIRSSIDNWRAMP